MHENNDPVLMEPATKQAPHQGGETAATAVATRARALVESRYIMAQHRPRDLDTVREKLLKECQRPGFAKVARYRKPVGNGIVGPSIRFAEAAVRCMTNIVVETTTLFDDREKRIIEVSVTDLETNVPYSSSVTVLKVVERKSTKSGDVIIRERLNSKNEKVFLIEATEDDILNKQNALISKALRTNALRLLPGDILEECMVEVVRTQQTADAKDPDAAKREIFDAFADLGVPVAQLKAFLGHDGAALNPKELADLRATYRAIKDGETTWREVMDAKVPAEKPNLSEALKQKMEGAK